MGDCQSKRPPNLASATVIKDYIQSGSSRTFVAQKLHHDGDYVSIERGLDDDEINQDIKGDESV